MPRKTKRVAKRTKVRKTKISKAIWAPTKVFRVRQLLYYEAYATTTITVPLFKAYTFKMQDINGYAELTAMFDSYRFHKIHFTLIPRLKEPATIATAIRPYFTVLDYDDGTALAAIADALEYGPQCKEIPGCKMHTRTFVPRAALAAYGGAFTKYAQASPKTWMDCANPDIEFYGIKMAFPASTANGDQIYDLKVTYELDFLHKR